MTPDWTPLRRELAQWRKSGLRLPIWWRDDDAIAPTPELERLEALSRDTGVPVHLAIIPQGATRALARGLSPRFIPVVHGWGHHNHAPHGQKKAEFAAGRAEADLRADLMAAMARMRTLFGAALAPMFVPPWNRLGPGALPVVGLAGFDAVSTYLPRKSAMPVPGLVQINTHIDPIFWRGTRGLVPPDTLVAQTVSLLRDRRQGRADRDEPLGYLTHHLVHDADIWEFSRQFLTELGNGPVDLYRHDEKDLK